MQCSIVNSIRLDVGQLVFFAVVLAFVTVLSSTEVCAKAQHVGGECNWTKNCVASVEGVGPAWAGNAVTCAVPKDHSPETCGSNDPKKNDFYGTCKAVGTLTQDEYGCLCGVHKGDCPYTSSFRRMFQPQDWMKQAWPQLNHP